MTESLPEHAFDKLLRAASPLGETPIPMPPMIGRYRVIRELGRGAVGVVYEALDSEMGRRVALKLLSSGLTGAQSARRFEREAKVAAALVHPNVVKLHDMGEHRGWLYLVMELVEGRSFRGVMEDPAVGLQRKLAILEGAARGVAAAHERGIVHRDLKPENVIVDAEGAAKVGDFGLAFEESEDHHRLTRTVAVLGTPPYMSPEQLAGASRKAGPASDVYSLGAILYEVLTGTTPFIGNSPAEIYARILEAPAQMPRHVPQALSRICLKALQRDPADRYPDAGRFADDLRRHLDGRPVTARVQGRGRHAGPLAGILVIALLALGVTSLLRETSPSPGPPPPRPVSAVEIDHAVLELNLRTAKPMALLADRFQGVREGPDPAKLLDEVKDGLAKFTGRPSWKLVRSGLAAFLAGRTDEGLAEIDRGGLDDPDDPLPLLVRAHAWLATYVRGLPVPPVLVEPVTAASEPFAEAGDLPRLRDGIRRSVERARRRPGAEDSKAIANLQTVSEGLEDLASGRYAEAARRFRAVDELSWLRDEACVLDGVATFLSGAPAEAAPAFERIRTRRWPRASLWGGAARLARANSAVRAGLDASSEFLAAEELLTSAVDGDPVEMRTHWWRGRMRRAWGDWLAGSGEDAQSPFAGAFVDLHRARAMAPQHLEVRAAWGQFLVAVGDDEPRQGRTGENQWREAVETFEALRQDPAAGPGLQYWAGRAWHGVARLFPDAAGRDRSLERAHERLAEAVRLDGANAVYRLALGRVLRDLGRAAEAMGEFREALRLDPSFKEAQEAVK